MCSPEDLITFGGRDSFDSETLWNYEVGSSSFAGGRGQFNIAAFYAEIEDLQMPVVAGTCSSRIVFNVPKAHSTGVELELSAAPTDRFDFGISASYTESEIDSSVTSTTVASPPSWRASRRAIACRRAGVPAVGQCDLRLAVHGDTSMASSPASTSTWAAATPRSRTRRGRLRDLQG